MLRGQPGNLFDLAVLGLIAAILTALAVTYGDWSKVSWP